MSTWARCINVLPEPGGEVVQSGYMEKLYTEEEYTQVKKHIIDGGKIGSLDDIFEITQRGFVKAHQIQKRLIVERIVEPRDDLAFTGK